MGYLLQKRASHWCFSDTLLPLARFEERLRQRMERDGVDAYCRVLGIEVDEGNDGTGEFFNLLLDCDLTNHFLDAVATDIGRVRVYPNTGE